MYLWHADVTVLIGTKFDFLQHCEKSAWQRALLLSVDGISRHIARLGERGIDHPRELPLQRLGDFIERALQQSKIVGDDVRE